MRYSSTCSLVLCVASDPARPTRRLLIHGASKSSAHVLRVRLVVAAQTSRFRHVASPINCDVVHHRRRRVLPVVCTSSARPDGGTESITNVIFLRESWEVRQMPSVQRRDYDDMLNEEQRYMAVRQQYAASCCVLSALHQRSLFRAMLS